jgi:hypothetical protein
MGLCNSPDIFQDKISCQMGDLEYVTKVTYLEHLQKIATVLARLQQAGLKVNANKSWFAQEELAYLHYWITKTESNQLKKRLQQS